MKACTKQELQQHLNKIPNIKTTMEFKNNSVVKIWYNSDGPVALKVYTDKEYYFIME